MTARLLKTKDCQFDHFVITGGTVNCRYDNLRCHQRRQNCQIDNLLFWMIRGALQWRHNGCDGVSNHQHYDCLFNRLFRHRSLKTSKLRFTGLCGGNSPVTDEFPAQMTSNAENVSIWWRHHGNRAVLIPERPSVSTGLTLGDFSCHGKSQNGTNVSRRDWKEKKLLRRCLVARALLTHTLWSQR